MSRRKSILQLNAIQLESRLVPAFGDLLHTLNNPSPAEQDEFGFAVAVDGDLAVIGAQSDDTGAVLNTGRAYVFNLTTGALVATLNDPTPGSYDYFGASVDISGTRVIVGTPFGGSNGQVYVFDVAGGGSPAPFATINSPALTGNDTFNLFGWAVAISGTRVAIGTAGDAPNELDFDDKVEKAYVYETAGASPTLIATLNNPAPATNDNFSQSLDIDGNLVVVGADRDDPNGVNGAGSAYVFDISTGATPAVFATLNNPSPATSDYFGSGVAIKGTRVVVGADNDDTATVQSAGSAFVFNVAGGTPVLLATLNNPSPIVSGNFGEDVAISDTRIVVGAFGNTASGVADAGVVYVFDAAATGTPAPRATLSATPAANDRFGRSVAVSGNRVVTGAALDDPNGVFSAGTAYAFDITPPPPALLDAEFSIGSDGGTAGTITLHNPDKSVRFTTSPFGTAFRGGIRTASGDFTGDGIADLAVASGPGMAGTVKIFDGATQKQIPLPETVAGGGTPFGSTFTKGIIVAAGDLNADGKADLIITAEAGGGARVRIFQGTGAGFTQRSDFIALIGGTGAADSSFRGGSRAAVSDINGDGTADLVWAAGAGGGPRIATFNGKLLNAGSNAGFKLTGDFFALGTNLRDGAYIAGGDIDGDGFGDLIAGGGSGAPPQVVGYSGATLVQNKFTRFLDFNFGTNSAQGIRVAVKDLNGDANADLVLGSAPGAGSRVAVFSGKNLAGSATGTALFDFTAFPGFTGGVFVG